MKIKILKSKKTSNGWGFVVGIENGEATSHKIVLRKDIWNKLKGHRDNPEDLIIDSFKFLLERESKESILKEFNLELIGKYFPEYEKEIKK